MRMKESLVAMTATGRDLLREDNESCAHDGFYSWDAKVASWLDELAPESGLSAQWSALPASNLCIGSFYQSEPGEWHRFRQAVQKRLSFLATLTNSLSTSEKKGEARPTGVRKASTSVVSGKVFVVHGRDEARRESVARYIEKLGLTPVILHEQPNAGRTIIEKFVHFAEVSFAVVLLTADDCGGLADSSRDSYTLRARQNVLFELGFFIAKLGRENVCALYERGVEIPSDYGGVVFIEMDTAEAWQFQLAREMKHAHLPIDINHAI